ncbi:MAG: hypothetical protein M1825_006434 [Sarcosagium campestre]|nr:MAG: hypothetical protein M1825_006434 [Sarcosagium campestre]
MSADLLELDGFYQGQPNNQSQNVWASEGTAADHGFQKRQQPTIKETVNFPLEDKSTEEWGEFESSEQVEERSKSQPLDRTVNREDSIRAWSGLDGSPTKEAENQISNSTGKIETIGNAREPNFSPYISQKERRLEETVDERLGHDRNDIDSEVLFDATDPIEDDEFGDFEDVSPVPVSSQKIPTNGSGQLLDLDEDYTSPIKTAASERGRPELDQFDRLSRLPPEVGSLEAVNVPPKPTPGIPQLPKEDLVARPEHQPSIDLAGQDDDWGDFGGFPSMNNSGQDHSTEPPNTTFPSTTHEPKDTTQTVNYPKPARANRQGSTKSEDPPPTNIPPPSLLLSLFPPLFETAAQKISLFKPRKRNPTSSTSPTNPIETPDPTTLDTLLSLGLVAGRIIAGRKLRWKRDTFLSQGMKIGPAARSGTSGGMKLTGVDRSEAIKEEREASDAVRAWKVLLGPLRSAVAASSVSTNTTTATGSSRALVPELNATTLPVRIASQAEGALTAPRQCVLCGLKRDERVDKVDVPLVEDSFGEWWVEHWGHVACKAFWMEHKGDLLQR